MDNVASVTGFEELVGKSVQINRGGPESRRGRLLAVKPDHLILQTDEEGIVYYRLDHVKSVTTDARDVSDLEAEPENVPVPYEDAADFGELLQNMNRRYVQINRGGPECIQGFLAGGADNHILLIANHEVVRILTSHIQNISHAVEQSQKDNADKKNGDAEGKAENEAQPSGQVSAKRQTENATNGNFRSDAVLFAMPARGKNRLILRRAKRNKEMKAKRKESAKAASRNRGEQRETLRVAYTGPKRIAANSFANLWLSGVAKAGR